MDENGPQERFTQLLEQHRGIPFKVAAAYCRAGADRDDVVQNIALAAWRAYPRYDASRPFSTWLYRIALNVAISWFRETRRKADLTVALDDASFERIVSPASDEDGAVYELYALIDTLNEFDRALIVLYLDGEPYAAIAEILGVSQTNVSTKINRIKERLRRTNAGAQHA